MMLESEKFSPRELREETFGFLIAGQETTAKNVLVTILCISQFPGVQDKVLEEIDRVLGDKIPDWDDEHNLPYLKAVVMESHRYYPVVQMFNRTCAEDTLCCEYFIPKGISVWFSPHVIHRNPNVWQNPNSFLPERFMETQQPPSHKLCAFGAGSRMCIGKNFAINEALTILGMIYQKFTTKLMNKTVKFAKIGTTITPTEDLMFQFSLRKE